MKIGLLIADIDEYAPFLKRTENSEKKPFSYYSREACIFDVNGSQVYTVVSGVGKANAAAAAMFLAQIGCGIILNFGYAGGMTGVRKGETVLCDSFAEHDFDLSMLGYPKCKKPGEDAVCRADDDALQKVKKAFPHLKTGLAVTGDCFISDKETKEELISRFSPLVCDMESSAIASVCALAGIPFIALKSVSDGADDSATDIYRDTLNTDGKDMIDTALAVIGLFTE